MAENKILSDIKLAEEQWSRYTNGIHRGHDEYQKTARRNENFYIGDGRQWSSELTEYMNDRGLPTIENNLILPTINTILGTQSQNRMDITYKPRESVDQPTADILSKVAMFVVDSNKYSWVESDVFKDGIIQQRGYFDVKLNYDDNFYGEIEITRLDPLNVIPDPSASSENPDEWDDVIIQKWLTLDDIKIIYGKEAHDKVKVDTDSFHNGSNNGLSFVTDDTRNTFESSSINATLGTPYFGGGELGDQHVRIIDRQYRKLEMVDFWYDPETGEIEEAPTGLSPKKLKAEASRLNRILTKRPVKKIRWTVSTMTVILHDEWSPYEHFTVVPYFPNFNRGKTIGVVDNLINTQEIINKTHSQMLHIINTSANSGWLVEENALVNMKVEDLEDVGSKSGVVLEYKKGSASPSKITANGIPSGLKDIMNGSIQMMREISGVSETVQGGSGNEISGLAIQSRVAQSGVQMSGVMDALLRTRTLVGERILSLMQRYYTSERVFLITNESLDAPDESVNINATQDDGSVINDFTAGKYDIVVADVPTAITFENQQFAQAVELRKFGIEIPDEEMVTLSTLSRKKEIVEKMQPVAPSEEAVQLQQAEQELVLAELKAKISKLEADANKRDKDALKATAETATLISENPEVEGIMSGLGGLGRLNAEPPVEQPPVEQPVPNQELAALFQPGDTAPTLQEEIVSPEFEDDGLDLPPIEEEIVEGAPPSIPEGFII
jgi:hypothetical protein